MLFPNLLKLHSLQVKLCVNKTGKKILSSFEKPLGTLRFFPSSLNTCGGRKEEEEERCTVEGPPACLRGSKPDTAYDLTNNVSFCTADSDRVYLISKNGH